MKRLFNHFSTSAPSVGNSLRFTKSSGTAHVSKGTAQHITVQTLEKHQTNCAHNICRTAWQSGRRAY